MSENIMKDFLKNCKCLNGIVYHNETAIGKINENLLAKIELHGGIEADRRFGLNLKIINKTTGLIDAITFDFVDIIGKCKMYDGKETMYQLRRFTGEPFKWVYEAPSAMQKKQIMEKVYQYIELYK